MIATVDMVTIAIGLLSGVVEPEVNKKDDACLCLLSISTKNISSSIIDDTVIDAKYIPDNFTVIRTNLTFICEDIFTNNKELAVGEVLNCTRGEKVTSAELVTKETISLDKATSTKATSATYKEHVYKIEPNITYINITYRNITDMCPKAQSPTFWQTEVSDWVDKIYLKVIGAVGLPGNMLAFVTILRMKPLTSSSLFIAVLAFSDMYVLILKVVYIELYKLELNIGGFACGFFFWTVSGMAMFSHWLVVLMTIERLVAVWFPLRVKILCTKTKAVITIVVVWVALMGLNFHTMWTITWREMAFGNFCWYHPDHVDFLNGAWYWLDALFSSIIAAVFLIFCNLAIVIGMRRSQALQKNMNVREEDMKEKIKSQQQMTIMLLAVSITFVVLTGPVSILFIYQTYWDHDSDPYEYAKYSLASVMVYVLLDMNYAVNFYMYFLTGRKFRVQLSKMFGCYNPPKRSAYGTTLATSGAITSKTTDVSMVSMSNDGDV